MRTALISDIHANIEALESVMEDIDGQNIDEIVCLGDIVGYGANPNECVSLIRKRCPLTLLGNHDAAAVGLLSTEHFNIHARIAIDWTMEHLTEEARSWLAALPVTAPGPQRTYVHATPYEPNMWYYITSLEEAAFNFQFFETTFCFVGHTHIPIIIVLDEKNELYVHQEETLKATEMGTSRFLINVGSVGQPRDHNPRSCYAIIDSDEQTFNYRRVTYDIARAQAKMKKNKMPEFLIMRLQEGR